MAVAFPVPIHDGEPYRLSSDHARYESSEHGTQAFSCFFLIRDVNTVPSNAGNRAFVLMHPVAEKSPHANDVHQWISCVIRSSRERKTNIRCK